MSPLFSFFFFIISATIGPAISYGKLYLFHLSFLPLIGSLWSYRQQIPVYLSSLRDSPVLIALFVWCLWLLLSLSWSLSLSAGIRQLMILAMGLSIMLALWGFIQNQIRLQQVFKLLVWLFCIEISLAILESITPWHLPISVHSPLSIWFGRAGAYPDAFVPTGFRWNPNHFALTLLILLPFFLCWQQRIIATLGTLIVILLMIQTQSRGVLLAVPLVFAAYIGLYHRQYLKITGLIVGLSGMGFYVNWQVNDQPAWVNIKQHITAVYHFKDYKLPTNNQHLSLSADQSVCETWFHEDTLCQFKSLIIRKQLADNAWQGLLQSQGRGQGAGSETVWHAQHKRPLTESIRATHHFWLQILLEGGVLALLCFGFAYIYSFWQVYQLSRQQQSLNADDFCLQTYLAQALSLAFIGFSIGGISASGVFYFSPLWLMWGLAVSLSKPRLFN